MRWSLSRLRPQHLVVLSALYWIGLVALKLGGAMLAAWWISRLPPGHGSASAGFDNGTLYLTLAQDGAPIWAGRTALVTLLAMVVGPPLLLALTWHWAGQVERAGGQDPSVEVEGPEAGPGPALPGSPPPWAAWPDSASDKTRVADPERTDSMRPRTPPSERSI